MVVWKRYSKERADFGIWKSTPEGFRVSGFRLHVRSVKESEEFLSDRRAMAPRSNSASNSARRRIEPPKSSPGSSDGVLSRLNQSLRHSAAFLVSKQAASQVLRRAGKAFWYFSTSFLVLAVPLIIELDREAQLVELESHQTTVLGAPSQPPPGFLMRV